MSETPWRRLPSTARAELSALWEAWRSAEEAARGCPEREGCACEPVAEHAAHEWVAAALKAKLAAAGEEEE